jgi:hypothetical protein
MSLDGLRAAAGARVNWLWHGYLAPGNVTLLTSQWKAGKTTLLAILLDRMRQGGELAGLPVRAGKAVVLSEESAALWTSRSEKFDFGTHVCWICRPFRGKPRPVQWLGLIDDLAALHREHPFDLLALDPLASFLPGRSENNADAVLDALLPLQRLTEQGVAVLAQHHPRKKAGPAGTAARGSGALSGHADILIEMHWQGEPSETDRRRRLYAWSRHEETPRQLIMELNAAGTDYTVLAESDVSYAQLPPPLLAVLRGAWEKLMQRQILERWPADQPKPERTALWRWLEAGVRQKLIQREGKGSSSDPFCYWLVGQEEVWEADPAETERQRMAEAIKMTEAFRRRFMGETE